MKRNSTASPSAIVGVSNVRPEADERRVRRQPETSCGGRQNGVMSVADHLGLEHRLATYGTLAPGRPNAHLLDGLAGTWTVGTIKGHLHERGWGADEGYPGIVLDDSGPVVHVHVFASRDLAAHWQRLDDFEGPGYWRVPVSVSIDDHTGSDHCGASAEDRCISRRVSWS